MKFTDVVPEDQDFGLNGGRKSQNDDWVIGVVGGDAAKSDPMSDRGSVQAMLTNYQGECYGGAQQQCVGLYARFQRPIRVQGTIPGCQQANTPIYAWKSDRRWVLLFTLYHNARLAVHASHWQLAGLGYYKSCEYGSRSTPTKDHKEFQALGASTAERSRSSDQTFEERLIGV